MPHDFDLSVDDLADAPLTPEQRRSWNALRGELASMRSENQTLLNRLHQLEQQKDDLEGEILARPDFNREVARMLAFDERYGGMSSVLYFDFDGLEAAQGKFGAAVINNVVREIANLLSHNVRRSDIVGRLAPDEFGVLLMRCDNASAWRKAEDLAVQLQKTMAGIQNGALGVSVSYGAYTFRDNEDLAVGLKEAAQAMTRIAR